MITKRSLTLDFRLLSNGIMQYPLFYFLGLIAMAIPTSGITEDNLNARLALTSLAFCSISHIASEKADKVADRIVLEHGGFKRRLKVRIVTTFIWNICLIIFGVLITEILHSYKIPLTTSFVAGALLVAFVYSTAGTIVAAAMPHPFVSALVMGCLLLAGGSEPDQNFTTRSLIHLTSAIGPSAWSLEAFAFASPWILAASLLYPFAVGRKSLAFPKFPRTRTSRLPETPVWVNLKPSFPNLAFIAGVTNPLILLSTVLGLALYTSSSLLVAAKFADLNVGPGFFYLFPGQIMVNVLPALLLATSVENLENADQERFLFKSAHTADLAQILRISITALISVLGITAATVIVLDAHVPINGLFRTAGLEAILIPGMTTIAVAVRKRVRIPGVLTLASFLLTFTEVLLSKVAPALKPWFPSSLFSAAAGGAGLYVQSPEQIAPTWVALAFVALVGIGPLVWKFWPRRKVS